AAPPGSSPRRSPGSIGVVDPTAPRPVAPPAPPFETRETAAVREPTPAPAGEATPAPATPVGRRPTPDERLDAFWNLLYGPGAAGSGGEAPATAGERRAEVPAPAPFVDGGDPGAPSAPRFM